MSLNPRAIALQGVGFEVLPVALQGFVGAGGVPPPPPSNPYGAGGSRADRARPRIGRFPDLRAPEVIQEPPRRRRRKREGDWLVFSSKH